MKKLITIILLFPVIINSQFTWNQLGQDIDGESSGDNSGHVVSINDIGNIVAIGAPYNSNNSGHVRVYEYNGINWIQLGQDIDGEFSGDMSGWSVSLDSTGYRLAIGSPYHDGPGGSRSQCGQVRIFQWNGSIWTQVGNSIYGTNANDNLGYHVAMNSNGETIAIGEKYSTTSKVVVLTWYGSFWGYLGGVINEPATAININNIGDKIVISNSKYGSINNSGKAEIYEYSSLISSWLDISSVSNNSSLVGCCNFGISNAINSKGDKVVFINDSIGGTHRLYTCCSCTYNPTYCSNQSPHQWWIQNYFQPPQIAHSVSMDNTGEYVVIGNKLGTGGPYLNSGLVNTYKTNNLFTYPRESYPIFGESSNDLFGFSVSMNGTGSIIAVGAPENDGNGSNSGHVRIFGCQPSLSNDIQTACDTYTWIDGNTYTTNNNTATHSVPTSSGCDSIITLDLTIHNTFSTNISQTACDNYTASNGQTFSNSGNYILNLQTVHGCDSTVNLNLTINNSTFSTDTQVACDSYTWIDGNTYTVSNNSAQHITTNSVGCNHTTTLDLIINNSSTSIQNVSHCGNSFMMNGQIYSQNGTYTQTLTNAAGCDSTVNLNLTLNNNQFNVNFNTSQQAYLNPPFMVQFNNNTPNLSQYDYTWDFGDGNTLQSQNPVVSHIYQYNGLYDVTLYANDQTTGCTDSLYQHEFIYCAGGVDNPNGIVEQHAGDVTIYPNPTADYLTLEVKHYKGPIEVTLYDINGKILITQTTTKINLEDLPSGAYQMVVKYGEKQQGVRVLKN